MRKTRTRYKREAVGYVYAVQISTGPIKVGFSKGARIRIQNMQTACPYKMLPIGEKRGTQADEEAMHKLLERDHIRGEWFNNTPRAVRILSEYFGHRLTLYAEKATAKKRRLKLGQKAYAGRPNSIKTVRRTLADGTTKEYHYRRGTGERVFPETPENGGQLSA